MVYERRVTEEDPEVAAERDYDITNPTKKVVKKIEPVICPAAISEPLAIGSDSGHASSASSLKTAGSFKEAKASRKKRSRGVSGSSIKKDGGRFDMGYDDDDAFNDFDDLDDEDYYQSYQHRQVFDVSAEEKLCVRVGKELTIAIASDLSTYQLDHLTELLLEEGSNDRDRLCLIHDAITHLVHSQDAVLVCDQMGVYRLSVVLARLLNEVFTDVDLFEDWLSRASSGDGYVNSIFQEANEYLRYKTYELRGIISEFPEQQVNDIVESLVNGDEFWNAAKHFSLFHAEIIHRAIDAALVSRNSITMHRVASRLGQYRDHLKDSFDHCLNIALARYLALSRRAISLPVYNSLIHLFVKICGEEYVEFDERVKQMIPSVDVFLQPTEDKSGDIQIVTATVDANGEKISSKNYILAQLVY